jgi:protein phosphatase
MLLSISTPVVVVGDIHGHILDLFRTFGALGIPPERSYLFLGDLVDRGEFSTETLVLVFLLKVLFPSNTFIIRGNHEFREMTKQSGFRSEVRSIYDSADAEGRIHEAFAWIPICAVVFGTVFCVHGGIGPSVTDLRQLADIPRPLHSYREEVVKSLLWSDPCPYVDGFETCARGLAYYFDVGALENFLDHSCFSAMVRGHECVAGGVETACNGWLFTVFGASNYCGREQNKSGALIVGAGGVREVVVFPPIPMVKRVEATFLEFQCDPGRTLTAGLPRLDEKKRRGSRPLGLARLQAELCQPIRRLTSAELLKTLSVLRPRRRPEVALKAA